MRKINCGQDETGRGRRGSSIEFWWSGSGMEMLTLSEVQSIEDHYACNITPSRIGTGG